MLGVGGEDFALHTRTGVWFGVSLVNVDTLAWLAVPGSTILEKCATTTGPRGGRVAIT